MPRFLCGTGLIFGVLLAASSGIAQTHKAVGHKSILEKIEWTWAAQPDSVDPSLPNALLFGDSITRGYYPEVAKLLAGGRTAICLPRRRRRAIRV